MRRNLKKLVVSLLAITLSMDFATNAFAGKRKADISTSSEAGPSNKRQNSSDNSSEITNMFLDFDIFSNPLFALEILKHKLGADVGMHAYLQAFDPKASDCDFFYNNYKNPRFEDLKHPDLREAILDRCTFKALGRARIWRTHFTHRMTGEDSLSEGFHTTELAWSGVTSRKMTRSNAIRFCENLGDDVRLPNESDVRRLYRSCDFPWAVHLIPRMTNDWIWLSHDPAFGPYQSNAVLFIDNGFGYQITDVFASNQKEFVRCVKVLPQRNPNLGRRWWWPFS